MFTADEIEAVVVGLSLLGRTGDAGLQATAARVSQKIADVLPDGGGSLFETPPLLVSHWNAIPQSEVDYRLMRKAIREEEKLLLQYRDVEARDTERTICPLALVYYVDSVVLASWCELREVFRHFRLDRIRACRPTGELFRSEGSRLRTAWRSVHELFSS
jgi:predicted DNA-binding transcriptional regulator YafY